ncbi:DUF1573 domain-containing protein [Limnovirga soli]|nr:DUF1573 domain-containing protein [Limnovirga soli]
MSIINKIVWFVLVAFIFICCNSNKNPYENNLGIEPEVIAQMDTANYTNVLWADSVKNIGTIKTTDTAHIQFHFTNTGNKPLFIITVAPACGCTIASYSKEPVQPGKQGVVNAVYKWNGQIGALRKTIAVSTNTKNERLHTLVFYGEIVKDTTLVTTK